MLLKGRLRGGSGVRCTSVPCTSQHNNLQPKQADSQPSNSIDKHIFLEKVAEQSRRTVLTTSLLASLAPQAQAVQLPGFANSAWEVLGGGPQDLFFPAELSGTWDVISTLVKVEKPLGDDMIPNPQTIQRAIDEDLNRPMKYQVAFIKNSSGKCIYDRRFNTAALVQKYYPNIDFLSRITWNQDDPNVLELSMPSGLAIRTRVTRRSQEDPAPDRTETSEFYEQVFQSGVSNTPTVKASQCFTKYKWRDPSTAAASNGPVVVATQVVSDYLTSYDGEQKFMQAMNRPIVTYTYRMSFTRPV